MAQRPSIIKRYNANRHGSPTTQSGRLWYDGKSDTTFDDPTYGVETGQTDTQPQLMGSPRRLVVDMLLQCDPRGQPHEVISQSVREGDALAMGERMLCRRYEDQPVFGEGERFELRSWIDRVGHDANVCHAASY